MAKGTTTSRNTRGATRFIPTDIATQKGALLTVLGEGTVGELYPDGEPGEVFGITDEGEFGLISGAQRATNLVEVQAASQSLVNSTATTVNIALGATTTSTDITVNDGANTITFAPGVYIAQVLWKFYQNNYTGERRVAFDSEGFSDLTLDFVSAKLPMADGYLIVQRTVVIVAPEESVATVKHRQTSGETVNDVSGTIHIVRIV